MDGVVGEAKRMRKRALSLLSGGLDSILATRLIMDQGVEIEAIHFMTIFCNCTNKGCRNAALVASENLRIPLKNINVTEEYLRVVENPKHGYGANMNPCLDCRIFMFGKARQYMEKVGASFIITGEVLGERPMSQRRDAMLLIERESGLSGLIVRPLTARLFEETIPEKEGIIKREKLLGFRGRTRKPQISLARELGINEYPCPAGGCLLTDPEFARKTKDLIKHNAFTLENAKLLKAGRHFRMSPGVKLIIGRNERENSLIAHMAKETDMLLCLDGLPGPTAILKGEGKNEFIDEAGSIVAYYTKAKTRDSAAVLFWSPGEDGRKARTVKPATQALIDSKRL